MKTFLLAVSALVCACSSASIDRQRSDHLDPDAGALGTGGGSSSGGQTGAGGAQSTGGVITGHSPGGAVEQSTGGANQQSAGGAPEQSTGGAGVGAGGLPAGCLMACGFTAELLFPYVDTYAALRKSTARACWNDACLDFSLASLPADPPAQGTGSGVPGPGTPSVVVWSNGDNEVSHNLLVEADFWTDDRALLVDGDVYSLTVTSEEGRALVVRRRAHYETYATCAGTCQRAAFDGLHAQCCPRDEVAPSDTLYLGGPAASGCSQTYDFWCTENFRIETDSNGCESWAYDDVPNCTATGFDGGR